MGILENTIKNEGFKSKPYFDTRGNITFGHGLTYITEDESIMLVKRRLRRISNSLIKLEWYCRLNEDRQDVIVDMSYQMGVNGMLGFQKMIKAIEIRDYQKAALEILDSEYARTQTPNRAYRNALIMKTGTRG